MNNSERQIAPFLFKSLKTAANLIVIDGYIQSRVCLKLKKDLVKLGFNKIDYFEARYEKNLSLVKNKVEDDFRIFVAGYLGNIRLIDNLRVRFSNLHKA